MHLTKQRCFSGNPEVRLCFFSDKGEWQAMQNTLYLDELKEFEKGRLTG